MIGHFSEQTGKGALLTHFGDRMPLDIKDYIDNNYLIGQKYLFSSLYHDLTDIYESNFVDYFFSKYEKLGYFSINEDSIVFHKHFDYNKDIHLCFNFPRINELFYNRLFFSQPNNNYSLINAYKYIINSCNLCLKICSPFIDYAGIILLKDELFKLLSKNVKIFILFREAKDIEKIKKLFSNYPHLINIRRFHQHDKNGLSSIHAKLLIADGVISYVGSGELRKNSLTSNFEVGVIVNDISISSDIERAFDIIYEYSIGE